MQERDTESQTALSLEMITKDVRQTINERGKYVQHQLPLAQPYVVTSLYFASFMICIIIQLNNKTNIDILLKLSLCHQLMKL